MYVIEYFDPRSGAITGYYAPCRRTQRITTPHHAEAKRLPLHKAHDVAAGAARAGKSARVVAALPEREPVTMGERLMPGCECGAAARGAFDRCTCD